MVRRLGYDAETVRAWMAQHDGRCDICGRRLDEHDRNRRLTIDHDHTTGQIRGLLCQTCNTAIAMLGDSWAGVERALAYLRRTPPTL